MKPCLHCGSLFSPMNSRSRFCSDCYNIRDNQAKLRFIRYRVTQSEYDAMYFDQDGTCAVCGEAEALCVDHNHETGRVRGLLCHACNMGLGYFKDRFDYLAKASSYLEETRHPRGY